MDQFDIDDLDQIDHAGSEAQARFWYQAELASQFCIEVLFGSTVESVVCEWAEDYLVRSCDGQTELVSVKHLEPNQPPWTVGQLANKGGLAMLYRRWHESGGRYRCRLQTNSGLRSGTSGPGELKRACETGMPAIEEFVPIVLQAFDRADPGLVLDEAAITRFLVSLRLEDNLPSRHYITEVNLDLLHQASAGAIEPALVRLAYETIVEQIAAASRATPLEAETGVRPAEWTQLGRDSKRQRLLGSKTLDKELLLGALAGRGIHVHAQRSNDVRWTAAKLASEQPVNWKLALYLTLATVGLREQRLDREVQASRLRLRPAGPSLNHTDSRSAIAAEYEAFEELLMSSANITSEFNKQVSQPSSPGDPSVIRNAAVETVKLYQLFREWHDRLEDTRVSGGFEPTRQQMLQWAPFLFSQLDEWATRLEYALEQVLLATDDQPYDETIFADPAFLALHLGTGYGE